MRLKIAIVVPGRFHGFDLARSLLERGHDTTLFTNYPKWAVQRFDFPGDRVRSFWTHGVITRIAWKLHQVGLFRYRDELFNPMFSRWAAGQISKEHWDVIHVWSGVAEEILQAMDGEDCLTLLMRGSAHIKVQSDLLAEEEQRTGARQDRPSPWIIARELREYVLVDKIVTLSSFARNSFISEGVMREKIAILSLGARLTTFRPTPQIIAARCRRILGGEPLTVLCVGAISFQKGFYDAAEILLKLEREIRNGRFRFLFVGQITPEAKGVLARVKHLAQFVKTQPENQLPHWYQKGDVFMFPTIQDGFAVVLAQANVSGLPIVATTNCGAPDLIREGKSGWVLPIHSTGLFVDRLRWADAHRQDLADMVERIYGEYRPRGWREVAADFEAICLEQLAPRKDQAALYGR